MEKLLYVLLFCYAFLNSSFSSQGAGLIGRVKSLPGFNGSFPSNHYSGYVSIGTKHLFYYFVKSERSSSKDPVVLWLNGGPGCSSFDGFVYEHGPFNFEAGKKPGSLPTLHLNPYSWSKVSNIIYLDSPAGVGLSYATNDTDYITGDLQTAADTHSFLLKWFDLFPEFVNNTFYISGESYAGIYVPTLASAVVKGIQGGVKPKINFKGYLIGNGVTDPYFDGNALVPFTYGMGLISNDMYMEVTKACARDFTNNSDICDAASEKVHSAIRGLNIYDILEPCYHDPAVPKNNNLPPSFQQLGSTQKPLPVRKRIFGRAWPYRTPVPDGIVSLWPELNQKSGVPCVNDEVATAWLNDEGVRKAIHAKPVSVAGEWEICTGRITFSHDTGSMIPYHVNLTSLGYRALIYSGDHDMCVPFTGSQAWTRSVGKTIIDEWRPWESNDQIAGYIQGYAHNLTFLTIKGAGHTVPEYKPRESLDFYTRWLDEKQI